MEETLDVAQNTISLLKNQTQKINNIENKVNNIDNKLSYSEYLVNKMSSILFNIFNKNIFFYDSSNESLDKINESSDKINESSDKINESSDKINESLDKNKLLDKDQLLDKSNESLHICNDLENLKNLNLLIGDQLDLHNEKLTNLHNKMETTETRTELLNKSIRDLTY